MLKSVELYYLIKLLQSITIVIVIINNNVIIYWSLSYIILTFYTSNVYKSLILPKAAFICIIYLKNKCIPVMAKLNFQHHYFSLKCHMIIILICWFAAQETFLNTAENSYAEYCLWNRFLLFTFYSTFTVTYDQLNVSLLYKLLISLKKWTIVYI